MRRIAALLALGVVLAGCSTHRITIECDQPSGTQHAKCSYEDHG